MMAHKELINGLAANAERLAVARQKRADKVVLGIAAGLGFYFGCLVWMNVIN